MTTCLHRLPGVVTPGQRTIIGSRIPPSYIHPLPPRSGRLLVGCPSDVDSPPLSDMKNTTVFCSSPSRFNPASHRTHRRVHRFDHSGVDRVSLQCPHPTVVFSF